MRRTKRIWRFARWTGIAATLGIAVIWGVAVFSPHVYAMRTWSIHLFLGRVVVDVNAPFTNLGWHEFPLWEFYDSARPPISERLGLCWPRVSHAFGKPIYIVPCWCLAAAAVLVIALASWRAGRFEGGRCRACGYNLTGNTTDRCPECGEETPATTLPESASPGEA